MNEAAISHYSAICTKCVLKTRASYNKEKTVYQNGSQGVEEIETEKSCIFAVYGTFGSNDCFTAVETINGIGPNLAGNEHY